MAVKKYKLVKRMSPYQEQSVFAQHFVGYGEPSAEEDCCAQAEVDMTLEFGGTQYPVEDLAQRAVDNWIGAGHDESELTDLKIYVKPEDKALYYVANGAENGKVGL